MGPSHVLIVETLQLADVYDCYKREFISLHGAKAVIEK